MPHTALCAACSGTTTPWLTLLTHPNPCPIDTILATKAAMEILPPAPRPLRFRHTWQDQLATEMLEMATKLQVTQAAAVNAVHASDTTAVTEAIKTFTRELQADPRAAWKLVHATRPRAATVRMPALDDAERARKFQAHFSQLFEKGRPPPNLTKPSKEVYPQAIRWRTGPITEQEVTRAVATLQCNKASGPDGVPNEILKLPEMTATITRTLNQMTHDIPQGLKTSTIVPLPKKGDLADTNNWRGICLMPHITKLYDKVLMLRLRDAIDSKLTPTQNGFRPGRGTAQHSCAFRAIMDIAECSQTPLHGCFVDFSKAFDSVYWDAIQEQLAYWRAPQNFINAVFNVMIGHALKVRVGDEPTDNIPVSLGVLQGDTLAPYLFVMVLDAVLRKLPDKGFLLEPGVMHLQSLVRVGFLLIRMF
eukprot:PhM_4_TR15915/c1_g3_i16/m.3274